MKAWGQELATVAAAGHQLVATARATRPPLSLMVAIFHNCQDCRYSCRRASPRHDDDDDDHHHCHHHHHHHIMAACAGGYLTSHHRCWRCLPRHRHTHHGSYQVGVPCSSSLVSSSLPVLSSSLSPSSVIMGLFMFSTFHRFA